MLTSSRAASSAPDMRPWACNSASTANTRVVGWYIPGEYTPAVQIFPVSHEQGVGVSLNTSGLLSRFLFRNVVISSLQTFDPLSRER